MTDRGLGPAAGAAGEPSAGLPCLLVEEPGVLATVQDLGRPGLGRLGVTRGGAADADALAVANALLGNPARAAALELTLPGVVLRATRRVTVALAGADLGARVRADLGARVGAAGEPVPPGQTVALAEGGALAFEGVPPERAGGCRAYVAVPGGVAVAPVLGSRSTALAAGFGGLGGRALRPGDVLAAAGPGLDRQPARWTGPVTDPRAGPFRVLPGPHGSAARLGDLVGRAWTVSAASDRVGLRLEGEPLAAASVALASHGVLPGAVQLPPDGRPIVLLVDHQPTGGYPVIAVVASVDRPRLGQLAPGAGVRFEAVDEAAARRLSAARRRALAAAHDHLRDAQAWDALWRGAGG